jgi:anti-sigma regulatory factor (Ser/Thr protein kinase)
MSVDAVALRASVDLPTTSHSVPAARRIVRHLLTGWSAEVFSEDALLLLTELVSNAVRHVTGRAPLRVELSLTGLVLRIAVLDTSPVPPRPRAADADGGYGLRLVAAISDRWGSQERPDGKRVWAELRRS